MQNLYCLICGELTEAHDYADAIICDKCPVPTSERPAAVIKIDADRKRTVHSALNESVKS